MYSGLVRDLIFISRLWLYCCEILHYSIIYILVSLLSDVIICSRDVVNTFANVIITTQLLCEISCNDYNCNY